MSVMVCAADEMGLFQKGVEMVVEDPSPGLPNPPKTLQAIHLTLMPHLL